jgi:hypothetical protein
MKLYYVIAEKDLYPQYPHHADWPKQIAYCLQDRSIMLTEGKGHGLAGSVITLAAASEPHWWAVFTALQAEWFLSFIEEGRFADEGEFTAALSEKIGPLRTVKY